MQAARGLSPPAAPAGFVSSESRNAVAIVGRDGFQLGGKMNKLLSRKLGVTVATILTVVLQIDDPVRAAVAGAIAIAYVVAQGLVDRASVDRVADAVEEGLDEARKVTS